MLSRLNFCVNSQMPHASKNKHHKPHFFTHVVTVTLSSSKILTEEESTLANGHQDDNKTTYEANILCSLTFKIFQKHTFFHIKHLRPPSPKWRHLTVPDGPRTQPLGQSISLKFSLEARLESKPFESLINFLVFLVEKLWSKINK